MSFGGNMVWIPGVEIEFKSYDLEEYAYLYNRNLYNWLVDLRLCEPYEPVNPEWEKFKKLLEKFANPN